MEFHSPAKNKATDLDRRLVWLKCGLFVVIKENGEALMRTEKRLYNRDGDRIWFSPQWTIFHALKAIEDCHYHLNYLLEDEENHRQWQEFTKLGGSTSKDFENFMWNRLQPKHQSIHKHLKLVVSDKRVKRIRRNAKA